MFTAYLQYFVETMLPQKLEADTIEHERTPPKLLTKSIGRVHHKQCAIHRGRRATGADPDLRRSRVCYQRLLNIHHKSNRGGTIVVYISGVTFNGQNSLVDVDT